MRVVALVFLVKGLAVHGALSFGTWLLHPHPQLVASQIMGEFSEMFHFVFFAFFLREASRDMDRITNTSGRDITNLMHATAALVAFFKRLYAVFRPLVLKGVISTIHRLSHLAAMKQRGIPVPVAFTAPFGVALPVWSEWSIYPLMTGILLVSGVRSMKAEEAKATEQ